MRAIHRNLMPTDFDLAGPIPCTNAGELADEPILACLAWMSELEASLDGSRKALLALDLAGIERGTSEQVGLVRKFDTIRKQHPVQPRVPGLPPCALELEKELRSRGMRITDAVRLQAALLARMQGKLSVLANMLAGPSVDYGRLLVRKGRGRATLDRNLDHSGDRRRDWK